MRNNMLRGRWPILLGLLAAVAIAGCGSGGATGDISGKVLYDGKPLPSGRITFLCEGGDKPVLSCTIANGEYAVEKAAVGSAKVAVETFDTKSSVQPPPGMTPLPGSEAGPYVPIPRKYHAADTSGLTYTVVKGKQTKDFELTP